MIEQQELRWVQEDLEFGRVLLEEMGELLPGPLLAECERCHLKFITPERMLGDHPQVVEHYLREKHKYRACNLREPDGHPVRKT